MEGWGIRKKDLEDRLLLAWWHWRSSEICVEEAKDCSESGGEVGRAPLVAINRSFPHHVCSVRRPIRKWKARAVSGPGRYHPMCPRWPRYLYNSLGWLREQRFWKDYYVSSIIPYFSTLNSGTINLRPVMFAWLCSADTLEEHYSPAC